MDYHTIAKRRSDAETPRRVLDSIRRIVQTLRLFDRASEKKLGLSGAQAFILQKLRDGRTVSVNELAERTHTDQSSVSVVVQKLAGRGLLARKRSPRDARQMQIWITPRGKAKLRAAPRPAQDRLIDAVRQLPRRLREPLAIALERIVAETGGHRQTPTLFFEDRSPRNRRTSGKAATHA